MKLLRPTIPVSVKVIVAARKLASLGEIANVNFVQNLSLTRQLTFMLDIIRDRVGGPVQLDHDPALVLRKFNPSTGKYKPDANDPLYLIYREKDEHLEKTTGRKPGAERTVTTKGSDIGLRNKFRRLEGKPRKKAKINSRGFDKQKRKFR